MSDEQRTLTAWLELFDRLTKDPITQPARVPINYQGQEIPKLGYYLDLRNSEAAELERLSADVASVVARRGRMDVAEVLFKMGSKVRAGSDGIAVFPRVSASDPIDCWAFVKTLVAAGEPGDLGTSATPTSDVASKMSTPAGGSDPLILTALIAHHGYNQGTTRHREPIAGRALAKKAEVANGSVSNFWKKRLRNKGRDGSHSDYCTACISGKIDFFLSLWNGDVAPADVLQSIEEILDHRA